MYCVLLYIYTHIHVNKQLVTCSVHCSITCYICLTTYHEHFLMSCELGRGHKKMPYELDISKLKQVRELCVAQIRNPEVSSQGWYDSFTVPPRTQAPSMFLLCYHSTWSQTLRLLPHCHKMAALPLKCICIPGKKNKGKRRAKQHTSAEKAFDERTFLASHPTTSTYISVTRMVSSACQSHRRGWVSPVVFSRKQMLETELSVQKV